MITQNLLAMRGVKWKSSLKRGFGPRFFEVRRASTITTPSGHLSRDRKRFSNFLFSINCGLVGSKNLVFTLKKSK